MTLKLLRLTTSRGDSVILLERRVRPQAGRAFVALLAMMVAGAALGLCGFVTAVRLARAW